MKEFADCKILNIAAGEPFSKRLAQYLLSLTEGAPEDLPKYKVLLPTRRACRIVRETFLNLNNGKALLLPQLLPLGDVEEEDLSLMMFGNSEEFLDIPSAISPMKRRLLLAKLIRTVPSFVQGTDHALALASALAQFIDQVVVEELDFANLHKIVPEEFASHWQITLDFLKIISENWPKILEEENVIDVAHRRNLLLRALAQHWSQNPPQYPVIAAGSTGSIPAAGRLLGVIANMPRGQVILPGLDTDLDDEAWNCIEEQHPQHSLKILLDRIGVDRRSVRTLETEGGSAGRVPLATEMMLPAQVSSRWRNFPDRHDVSSLLNGIRYFSCSNQQEEAQLISILMREALEDSESVTALVTPDRGLARRVSALCRRWGIEVDDSAGQKLTETRLGKFMLLSAGVLKKDFDPVTLLSLLKISLCRFAQEDSVRDSMTSKLELHVLRQDDTCGSHEMLRTKTSEIMGGEALVEFMDAFYAALEPLNSLYAHAERQPFEKVLNAHIQVMESLAETPEKVGAEVLWRGEDGEETARFLSELSIQSQLLGDVTLAEYLKILRTLMAGITVRAPYGVHSRLLILGQFEARLSHANKVILGGLNEGVWPADNSHDPWMSRPMRHEFGLPGNEQNVGIAAHDFVQGFCGPSVVMTRSEKISGSPTVPSRWLDRLDTVLQSCNYRLKDLSQSSHLSWARSLDECELHPDSGQRPQPRPPVSARPQGVSVTKVDVWLKDPYAIYAYYILNLRKLRPLVQDNDPALRGTILHEILERFMRAYPVSLPDDAEDQFIRLALEVMQEKHGVEEVMRYWWPKILKIAAWFVAQEKEWREGAAFVESEVRGSVDIDIDGESFNLHGTADRIDRIQGGYAIIDYKTGGQFTQKAFKNGHLPQLPLEALMVSRGGFSEQSSKKGDKKSVPRGDTVYMGYWKMTGGAEAGKILSIEENVNETIEIVAAGLTGLVREFRKLETPFYAVPDLNNAPRFNDYEHLSRLKEWAALDEGEAA